MIELVLGDGHGVGRKGHELARTSQTRTSQPNLIFKTLVYFCRYDTNTLLLKKNKAILCNTKVDPVTIFRVIHTMYENISRHFLTLIFQ